MSSPLADLGPFLGFAGAGATDRMVQQGRRRSATLLAFLAFVLMAAAQGDEQWVSGGLEFSWTSVERPSLALSRSLSLCHGGCVSLGSSTPQLGDDPNFKATFNFGLHQQSVVTSYYYNYSGVYSTRASYYSMKDVNDNFNQGVAGKEPQWAGLAPIRWQVFASSQGLLIFASILSGATYLALAAVMYEVPFVINFPRTSVILRLMSLASSFFTGVGVLNFVASPVKNEFCSLFDPDGTFLNLPCGFGNGVNLAIAGAVFGILSSLLLWRGVSADLSVQTYSFGGASKGYSDAAAPLEQGADTIASFQGSSGAGAGGYSGFGSEQ